MALYRQEVCLIRCVAVVRRASCASHAKPAAACEASAGEPLLAVSEEENKLSSLLLRVRRAALVMLGQCLILGRCRPKTCLLWRAAVVRRSS